MDIQILTALVKDENEAQQVTAAKSVHAFPTELCLAFQCSQIDTAFSGHFISNVSIHGLMFSTFSKHCSNAYVLIRESNNATLISTEIVHIIEIVEEDISCCSTSQASDTPSQSILSIPCSLDSIMEKAVNRS